MSVGGLKKRVGMGEKTPRQPSSKRTNKCPEKEKAETNASTDRTVVGIGDEGGDTHARAGRGGGRPHCPGAAAAARSTLPTSNSLTTPPIPMILDPSPDPFPIPPSLCTPDPFCNADRSQGEARRPGFGPGSQGRSAKARYEEKGGTNKQGGFWPKPGGMGNISRFWKPRVRIAPEGVTLGGSGGDRRARRARRSPTRRRRRRRRRRGPRAPPRWGW